MFVLRGFCCMYVLHVWSASRLLCVTRIHIVRAVLQFLVIFCCSVILTHYISLIYSICVACTICVTSLCSVSRLVCETLIIRSVEQFSVLHSFNMFYFLGLYISEFHERVTHCVSFLCYTSVTVVCITCLCYCFCVTLLHRSMFLCVTNFSVTCFCCITMSVTSFALHMSVWHCIGATHLLHIMLQFYC